MIITRFIAVVTAVIISFYSLFGQVTSANYQLVYNEENCNYDCYIVIIDGDATTSTQRIQGGSQYTVIVPTGTNFSIVEKYMPLKGNVNYMGTIPINWSISSSIISPVITPEVDYHSIIPTISDFGLFNNLHPGDKVKLFSVNVGDNSCSPLIRLYVNGVDPTSSDPGMGGGDFSNGFVIGPANQVYTTNEEQILNTDAYVNTTDDSGEESLRFLSIEDCCIDTVYFDSSTDGDTIILDSEIVLNDSVVIIGNGILNTILDAQNMHRVFTIMEGAKLSLSNLTIQNAVETTNGGAIYNQGELILNNVVFKNNFEGTQFKSLTNKGNLIIKEDEVFLKN